MKQKIKIIEASETQGVSERAQKVPLSDKIRENDIYTAEGVESYSDDDAISNVEEGFMIGYLAA